MVDETPVVAQYLALKSRHPDDVLFFRLGDFYEMFNKDAIEVSRLLNLTLTHRGGSPMCGIPYHAAKNYIARLLKLGKKIAIAEQIGEVGKAPLTERKVIEVITPGTATESEYLDSISNNFLASFVITGDGPRDYAALAYIDITTGEARATKFPQKDLAENLPKELGRCNPKELILPESLRDSRTVQTVLSSFGGASISWYPDWHFTKDASYTKLLSHFKSVNLNAFSLTRDSPEIIPLGFLLEYIEHTTGTEAPQITNIYVYEDSQFVIMDDSSRRNLEVLCNLRDGSESYSLFEAVNDTKTSMGHRLLRTWLSFPLTSETEIRSREDSVELFVKDTNLLRAARDKLGGILDVERLSSRIAMDRAHAKDLQALRSSLSLWSDVQSLLSNYDFAFSDADSAKKIISLIASSILDDPATAFGEGRIIKDGWNEDLDYWRRVQSDFNSVLEDYAEEERRKNDIPNLKIKNTGSQGYYIEVTKGKLDHVPNHFIRRRSLLNAERYTTERLQELERSLNESSSKILELEHDLFLEVRDELKKYVPYLLGCAKEIAYVDAVATFAQAALRYNWVRPEVIGDSLEFHVEGGRHPVVELHIPRGEFVPNDLSLYEEGGAEKTFALITGPNMAGKSTFLRQNALIALLAQTGSFVPAAKARLGIVDRIFCRVGASDNLARGESTFLVEMTETARILRSATQRSLVIMDEVGRGTSTEDGLAIAWAVSEYLLNTIKCKTLFATHYHELTRLEHKAISFLCMAVSQNGRDVVFLRKVVPGASENSYGIHVARIAGVPNDVTERAEEVLETIQEKAAVETPPTVTEPRTKKSQVVELFPAEELALSEIASTDVDNITPLQALEILARLKKSLS